MHDVWLEYVSGRLGIHPAYDIFRLGLHLPIHKIKSFLDTWVPPSKKGGGIKRKGGNKKKGRE